MEERREYGRKEIRFKVVISLTRQPYRCVKAEATDLSMGGVGLKLRRKEAVENKERVFLRIERPFFQDSIEGTGEIVWQKSIKGSKDTLAGVKFFEIPYSKIKALAF
jgi:hypothetical protein